MKRTQQRNWRTAIHEAGHVAMILAHGLDFDHVTIKPADDYLGAVTRSLSEIVREKLATGDLLEVSAALEPLVRISFAGGVAVGIHCGKSGQWNGSGGDKRGIVEYMLTAHGRDGPSMQAHIRHLRFQSEALLSQPGRRWQVRVIAQALMERQTLSAKEVQAVLQTAAAMGTRSDVNEAKRVR